MVFGWEAAAACALGATCRLLLRGRLEGASRDWFLALLSAVVLGWWQPTGLVVTLVLVLITWLALRRAPPDPRPFPHLPAVAITAFVVALAAFKYAPGAAGWVVPLGLSFTVFRLIGVILDAHALRLDVPFSRLLALSLFFPTLPAGPITTVRSFRPLGPEEAPRAFWLRAGRRIVQGLTLKVLLADPLYALVIRPWRAAGITALEPYQCLTLPVLLGLYVYWDFAGYSDVAIGMAQVLGYQVPENFNHPYSSRSLIEFWRRWHITLSEWIRNRLMMKIAGRRPSAWRLHGATLASMGLCGLWHGSGVGFLVWGLWHGLGLVGLHLFTDAQRRHARLGKFVEGWLGDRLATALTFGFVTIGWTFFFLSPGEATSLLTRALAWRGGSGLALGLPIAVLGGLFLAHWGGKRFGRLWPRVPPLFRLVAQTVLIGILSYVLLLTGGRHQGFFYAQF